MGAAAVMEGDCTTAVAVTAGEAALASAGACAGSIADNCNCEISDNSRHCRCCCCTSSSSSGSSPTDCGDAECRLDSEVASPCSAATSAASGESRSAANVSGPSSLWRCTRGDAPEGNEVEEKLLDADPSAAAVSAVRHPCTSRSSLAARRTTVADTADRLLCRENQPDGTAIAEVVDEIAAAADTAAAEAEEEEMEEEEESDGGSSGGAKQRRQRLLTKLRKHPLFHDLQAALLHECLAAPRLPSALLCALPDDGHTSAELGDGRSFDGGCAVASSPPPSPTCRHSFETVSHAVLVAHVQVERDLAGLRPWTSRIGLVLEQSYRAAVAAAESERYAALLYNCHSEDCKRRINAYYDCERLVLAQWAQQHLTRRRMDIGLSVVRSTRATSANPTALAETFAAAESVSSCSAACAVQGKEEVPVGTLPASDGAEPATSKLVDAATGSTAIRLTTTSPQPAALPSAAPKAGSGAFRDRRDKIKDDRASGPVLRAAACVAPKSQPPATANGSLPSVSIARNLAPQPTVATTAVAVVAQKGLDGKVEAKGRTGAGPASHRSCQASSVATAAALCDGSQGSNRSSPQRQPAQSLLSDVPLDLSCKVGAGCGGRSTCPPGGHVSCSDQGSTVGGASEGISGRAHRQRSPGSNTANGHRDQTADVSDLRTTTTETEHGWERRATPLLLGSIKDGGVKKHMLSKYSWDCVTARGDHDRPAADATATDDIVLSVTSPVVLHPVAAVATLHDRAPHAALTTIAELGTSPQPECSPSLGSAAATPVATTVVRLGGRSRATLDDVVAQCLSGQKQRKRRAAAPPEQRPKQPASPQQQQPTLAELQTPSARQKAAPGGAGWVVNATLAPGAAAAATSVAIVSGCTVPSPSGMHTSSGGEASKGGFVPQQPAITSAAVKQEPPPVVGLYSSAVAADYLDLVGSSWPASHDDSVDGPGPATSVLESLRRVVNSVSAKPNDGEKGGCCGSSSSSSGSSGGRWHAISSIQPQQHQQQQQQRTGAATGSCELTSRHTAHISAAMGGVAPAVPCAPVVKLRSSSSAAQQAAPVAGCCVASSPVTTTTAAVVAGSGAAQSGSGKAGEGSSRSAAPPPVSQQQQAQPAGKRYLSHHARLVLNDWFLKHIRRPYPTLSEKILLAQQCGISSAKVDTWFANKRNRTHNTRKLLPKYSRLVLLKTAAGSVNNSAAVPSASAAPSISAVTSATAAAGGGAADPHRLWSGQPLPALPSL